MKDRFGEMLRKDWVEEGWGWGNVGLRKDSVKKDWVEKMLG